MSIPRHVRSRLYLAAAAVLALAVFAGEMLGGALESAAFWASWLVIFASLIGMVVTWIRLSDLSLRKRRFLVSPKGFHTGPAISPTALLPWLSVATARTLAETLRTWEGFHDLLGTMAIAAIVAGCLFLALLAALFVGRTLLTLTPKGLDWGVWPFRRSVAWDELVPGGPLRPHPGVSTLRLATRKGQHSLSTQVDVNPWLVADAIRWYVEHPEHRAGIGTQAEHDRLLAAVSAR